MQNLNPIRSHRSASELKSLALSVYRFDLDWGPFAT